MHFKLSAVLSHFRPCFFHLREGGLFFKIFIPNFICHYLSPHFIHRKSSPTLDTGHPLALPMGNWPRMRQSITYWYLLLLLSPAGCNKLRTRSDITICIARMPSLHLQTLSSPELHNCKTGEIVQFFRDLETLCKNENGSVSERMWPLQHFTTWTKLIFSTSFSSS